MGVAEPRDSSRLGRIVDVLRLVSLVDGLLLPALLLAALDGRAEQVAVLGPTHGVLFLILLATLAHGAAARWWRWRFVCAVALVGPLASIPGLERIRWRLQRTS